MDITWLGHSSFLIEDSSGRKILTDPFDETVGYDVYRGEPDLVTISHHHFDHGYVKLLPQKTRKLDSPGVFDFDGIRVTGIPSFHDKTKGSKRGKNTIFIIEADGYRLCHLGDLGYVLSAPEIESLGEIDVLMIPVGGVFTIDGAEAASLSKAIGSHIILPMHYKTPAIDFEIAGLEPFLSIMGGAEETDSSKLTLKGELKGLNQVKVLKYE
ncbi:MAG: beta-lactamase [Firmicutes bacterium]|nr:beta-lactamase [Bacillota bacterium]